MDDREALKFDFSEQTTEFGLTVKGKLVHQRAWPFSLFNRSRSALTDFDPQVERFCGRWLALARKPSTSSDMAQIRKMEFKADSFQTSLNQYLASNGSLKKHLKMLDLQCQDARLSPLSVHGIVLCIVRPCKPYGFWWYRRKSMASHMFLLTLSCSCHFGPRAIEHTLLRCLLLARCRHSVVVDSPAHCLYRTHL